MVNFSLGIPILSSLPAQLIANALRISTHQAYCLTVFPFAPLPRGKNSPPVCSQPRALRSHSLALALSHNHNVFIRWCRERQPVWLKNVLFTPPTKTKVSGAFQLARVLVIAYCCCLASAIFQCANRGRERQRENHKKNGKGLLLLPVKLRTFFFGRREIVKRIVFSKRKKQ